MKSYFLIYIFSLLLCFDSFAQAGCYKLVWADEFEYSGTPNIQKWGYDIGGHGWGNNELQYYTSRPENVRVENGNLIIEARKEVYQNKQYTSTRLVSKNKGDWKYGRIEVRAKLPYGRGTWPAIWMLPTDWVYGGWPSSGEIDIMEHVGYDQGRVHGTVHTEAYNHSKGTQKGNSLYYNDVSQVFHVYSIEWFEDRIDFFIDDKKYFTFTNENKTYKEWPFDQRFHLILNIAVGGNWGGAQGVDPDVYPQKLLIDYVRVYEISDKLEIDGPAVVTPLQENLTFSVNHFENVSYQWNLPAGAHLLSKMDSSVIQVNWGENGGDVIVKVIGEITCSSDSAVKEVNLVETPQGNIYKLDDFQNQTHNLWSSPNNIQLSENEGKLLVSYDNTKVEKVTFTPEVPLNIINHSIVKLKILNEGVNDSRLALSFEDANGRETITGIYNFTVPADDIWRVYGTDFTDLWSLDQDKIDPGMIKKINIYLPSGKGSISIKDFSVYINNIIPSPVEIDFIDQSLNWIDSEFATKYNLYFSKAPQGDYIKVKGNIPTNNNPFDLNGYENGFYKLSALNNAGESELSSEVNLHITSISLEKSDNLFIYPNPCSDRVFLFTENPDEEVYIINSVGETSSLKFNKQHFLLYADVSGFPSGFYLIYLRNANKTFKLVIQR